MARYMCDLSLVTIPIVNQLDFPGGCRRLVLPGLDFLNVLDLGVVGLVVFVGIGLRVVSFVRASGQ